MDKFFKFPFCTTSKRPIRNVCSLSWCNAFNSLYFELCQDIAPVISRVSASYYNLPSKRLAVLTCYHHIHFEVITGDYHLIWSILFRPSGPQGCSAYFPVCPISGHRPGFIPRSLSYLFSFFIHCSPQGCSRTSHDNAVIQLSSFILSTCPIHLNLLVFTLSLIFVTLVLLSISSFDTMYGHLIFNILRRHLNINTSIFQLTPSFIYQASHPYNRTHLTSELNSLNLVFNV